MPGRSRPRSGKTEPLGGQGGHLPDRLLEGEDPELADVDAEVARERAPASRVGLLADEDAVAAGHVRRVGHDRPDVLLVADVGDRARRRADRRRRARRRGRSVASPRPRPPRQRSAHEAAVLASSRTPEISMRDQSSGPAVEAVGARLLHLHPDALAQRRVGEARDRRVGPAGMHPARRIGVQCGRAGEVRVRVQRDVDALLARGVDHREQLRRAAPVHGKPRWAWA